MRILPTFFVLLPIIKSLLTNSEKGLHSPPLRLYIIANSIIYFS